jgi:hypothetical protein
MDRKSLLMIAACLAGGVAIFLIAQWFDADVARPPLVEGPPVPTVTPDTYLPPDVRDQVREMREMHRRIQDHMDRTMPPPAE